MSASKLGVTIALLAVVIGVSVGEGYKIGQRQFEANTKKIEAAKSSMAGIEICNANECQPPPD